MSAPRSPQTFGEALEIAERLAAENAELRAALQFYADPATLDGQGRARTQSQNLDLGWVARNSTAALTMPEGGDHE
jgi:hypothetical protein